jgi:hypothetical protein
MTLRRQMVQNIAIQFPRLYSAARHENFRLVPRACEISLIPALAIRFDIRSLIYVFPREI